MILPAPAQCVHILAPHDLKPKQELRVTSPRSTPRTDGAKLPSSWGLALLARSIKQKSQEIIESFRAHRLQVPETIVFGRNKLDALGELAFPLAWGQKALIVTGARSATHSGLIDRITTLLNRYTINSIPFSEVGREPTGPIVDAGAALARESKPRMIISVGGGSVIDCGKAVAALAVNHGSVEDYLEGVGQNLPVANRPLPHVAIPTVAGTGAEMTKNAVITSPMKGYKKSMRSDNMIPTIALIDPTLTIGVPPHIVASGGLDAIAQLIEPCISTRRSKATTMLALDGLRYARQSLALCYEDPNNVPAREHMCMVSMIGGACLANSGLAMAHGIAAALGALFDVPHGLACGLLLPHTLRYNRKACESELANALAAFLNQEKATGSTIDDGIAAIEGLNQWLQIPPDLKYLGLGETDLKRLAETSMGSSMSGNPVPMTPASTLAFLKTLV